jgi:hypothetical protein
MSSWANELYAVQHVVGYQIPIIHPQNYRATFQRQKDGTLMWHSQFVVKSCEGMGCCFPWCCISSFCSTDKDVHDHIIPSPDTAPHTTTLIDTTAFGKCGQVCGLEKGKVFHVLQSGEEQIFVTDPGCLSSGETFALSAQSAVGIAQQNAAEALLVRNGFRKQGFKMTWYKME